MAAPHPPRGLPSDIMIGRQPILDGQLLIVGYELLFRGVRDGHGARELTASVVVDALAEIGLDRLVGDQPAFLNVSRDFLLAFDPLPLPADRMVLELLEDQTVDAELLDRLDRLRQEGFALALDDYRHRPGLEPLLERASIVKLDVLALRDDELAEHVELLAPRDVRLLAEKVESRAQYARCSALGLSLFQGYFFAKPSLVQSQGVPADQLASLDVLSALLRTEGDFDALERVIRDDVGLVYKLLRWANSGLARRGAKVDSVHAALMRLGDRQVRQWALLATLAAGASDAPPELIRAALLRARVCELLASELPAASRASAYTVGLLSALDALLDSPLGELLARLPLEPAVVDAIVAHDGELGRILQCALRLETSHPETSGVSGPRLLDAMTEVDALARSVA